MDNTGTQFGFQNNFNSNDLNVF